MPKPPQKKNEHSVRGEIAKLLGLLLEPASREIGKALADKVRLYRWRTASRIIARADQLAKESRIRKGKVPYKFLIPFVENSSMEDENGPLPEMWARLLVNAVDQYSAKHRFFADILTNMSAEAAFVLEIMYLRAPPLVSGNFLQDKLTQDQTPSVRTERFPKGDAFHDVNEFGIDKHGRLVVVDYVIDREKKIATPLLRYGPNNTYLMESIQFLQQQSLLYFFGIGHASDQNKTDFVYWCELTELGFDLVKTCGSARTYEDIKTMYVELIGPNAQ